MQTNEARETTGRSKYASVPREYLAVRGVASRYSVSVPTVWRWAKDGQLPKPIKLNGSTRWKLADLMEWEQQQEAAS